MGKYFFTVNGIPVQLGDNLTDEEAKRQAREEESRPSRASDSVRLWEQTSDKGAVNVAF